MCLTFELGGGGFRSKPMSPWLCCCVSLDPCESFAPFPLVLFSCDVERMRSPFVQSGVGVRCDREGIGKSVPKCCSVLLGDGRMRGSLSWCRWLSPFSVGLLFWCFSRGTTAFSSLAPGVLSASPFLPSPFPIFRKLLLRFSLFDLSPFRILPISRPTSKTLRDIAGGRCSMAKGQMRSKIIRESR